MLFLVGVMVQAGLAGAFVFAQTSIRYHVGFVHVIEFIPLVMLACAIIGRKGPLAIWGSALLIALVAAQYALAKASPNLVSALHVVNALVIFGVALILVERHPPWRRMRRRAARKA